MYTYNGPLRMSSTVSPSESIGLFTFHVVVASFIPWGPHTHLHCHLHLGNESTCTWDGTVSTYSPCKTYSDLTGSSGMTQSDIKLLIPTRLAYPLGSDRLRTEPVAETIRIIMKS
jgi:hypothetical protein